MKEPKRLAEILDGIHRSQLSHGLVKALAYRAAEMASMGAQPGHGVSCDDVIRFEGGTVAIRSRGGASL